MATPKDSTRRSKKLCTDQSTKDESVSFTPRDYQIEILEIAKERNTIAYLGTGTGKTFIAVMLIRENANNVRIPFEQGGKRIFFLVPTVPLVNQQTKTIEVHTDLKVNGYYGEKDVNSWSKEDWIQEFKNYEVLVMTAEIFRIILDHDFISLKQIQLIIIDECHRANKHHPYRAAMTGLVGCNQEDLPRIFGLSASLLNGKCKPTKLKKRLKELEDTLMSSITTASGIAELKKYGTDPDEYIVYYSNYEHSASDLIKETKSLRDKLNPGKKDKRERYGDDVDTNLSKPYKYLNSLCATLSSLGPWCAYHAAQNISEEIQTLLLNSLTENHKNTIQEILEYLSYFMQMCLSLNGGSDDIHMSFMPDKLKRLLQILIAAKHSSKFNVKEPPVIIDVTFEEDPQRYFHLTEQNKFNEIKQQICSIIFVEQRITAYVLYIWLKKVKQIYPDLSFIKPDYIVGHGNVGIVETAMNEKMQRKKLKAFRDQHSNVLIATSVLEEGMDIRTCNVVVRFDLPLDFRSYVQSKGRARAKNSIYVLLAEDCPDKEKFLVDLHNFKAIEELLVDKCRGRELPTDEDITENIGSFEIPPYMPYGPEGPRITMSSSLALINRYCAGLPSDMATKLVPKWEVKKTDPDNIDTEYACILRMPINSPLKKVIEGEAYRKKKLAKMSAALKACKMLHEIGELNENLVPISCLVDKALLEELGDIEKEDNDSSGAQPGTHKRRQLYEKHVPVFLRNAKPVANQQCYLHLIQMDLISPLPECLNPRRRPIINPSDTTRGLGLLCSSKLPPVNPFPIFTKCGKILIDVKLANTSIVLNETEIKMAEEFHSFIFSDALWLKKGKVFSPDVAPNSYYILPTNIGNRKEIIIDWNFIQSTKKNVYHELIERCKSSQPITIYNENLFKDSVLLRSYKQKFQLLERPTFHHVVKIASDKSPNDIVDFKSNLTYKEYFMNKYKAEVKIDNQPLVETVQYQSLHMWKPVYLSPKESYEDVSNLSKTKQKTADYKEYLIPELCIIHPFSSPFFFKVICIPTVLFRFNSLLLAEELRQAVLNSVQIGNMCSNSWPPFHLETSDKNLREYLFEKGILEKVNPGTSLIPRDIRKEGEYIVSFEVNNDVHNICGPSPNLLLQAMTTKSAGDEFDLERLEMIGDSFLKYVMTIKIYVKYFNFDEGKLSLLRSNLIQNLRLYQKAKKKKLGTYLINTLFNCNSTWLPPCYFIQETVDEKSIIHKPKKESNDQQIEDDTPEQPLHQYFTKQVISDKSIADSVEALIGAYLLSSGQQGALRFMSWFGLKPLIEDTDDFTNWPPAPPNPIVFEMDGINWKLNVLTSGFDRFEKIINYKFKNKAYLLQAFTHPSYTDNTVTDCYQRLEFLGDAVLDYLITRQLYEDQNDHSPGKLTDLRTALVNNIYFASLAVLYKYNEFLKMLSPKLFALVNNYIQILKESEAYQYFEEHKYYLQEIKCFQLEEVEVPKALGDVFESVAGAIFLDSGMSLDAVWEVYFPMIKPSLDHLSQYVPVSPVRELHELVKTKNIFGEAVEKNGKTYIEVKLPNGETYLGIGTNKKVAKRSAAKRAVADMRKNKDYNEHLMDVS